MAKPVLSAVNVFDATLGTMAYFKIYITYESPSDVQAYEYTVYDGSEDEVTYTSSGTYQNLSYSLNDGWGFPIVPNSKLKNRTSNYYLKIRIRLKNETSYGEYSSPVSLYCKEIPSIAFVDLAKNSENIIQMSATAFTMTYSANAEQGETLKTYQYIFYDSDKNVIDESQTYYGSITHSFSVYGLESGKSYFIRGVAATKSGYELDTGFYAIKIGYSISNSAYAFEAKNDMYDASIRLTSHFISATGSPNGDFSYIKISDNKYAVALTNGSKISYFINQDLSQFDMKFVVNRVLYKDIIEIAWESNEYSIASYVQLCSRSFTDYTDSGKKAYAILRTEIDKSPIVIVESNYLDDDPQIDYFLVDIMYSAGSFSIRIASFDLNNTTHSS